MSFEKYTALSIKETLEVYDVYLEKDLSDAFKFTTPTADKLMVIFVIVIGYLLSTEIVKRLYFRYFNFT